MDGTRKAIEQKVEQLIERAGEDAVLMLLSVIVGTYTGSRPGRLCLKCGASKVYVNRTTDKAIYLRCESCKARTTIGG